MDLFSIDGVFTWGCFKLLKVSTYIMLTVLPFSIVIFTCGSILVL